MFSMPQQFQAYLQQQQPAAPQQYYYQENLAAAAPQGMSGAGSEQGSYIETFIGGFAGPYYPSTGAPDNRPPINQPQQGKAKLPIRIWVYSNY